MSGGTQQIGRICSSRCCAQQTRKRMVVVEGLVVVLLVRKRFLGVVHQQGRARGGCAVAEAVARTQPLRRARRDGPFVDGVVVVGMGALRIRDFS